MIMEAEDEEGGEISYSESNFPDSLKGPHASHTEGLLTDGIIPKTKSPIPGSSSDTGATQASDSAALISLSTCRESAQNSMLPVSTSLSSCVESSQISRKNKMKHKLLPIVEE